MSCRDDIYASGCAHVGITPEFDDRKVRELWRELARPVTLFDLRSPDDLLDREIGEFFRKWCARRACDPRLRRQILVFTIPQFSATSNPGISAACGISLNQVELRGFDILQNHLQCRNQTCHRARATGAGIGGVRLLSESPVRTLLAYDSGGLQSSNVGLSALDNGT